MENQDAFWQRIEQRQKSHDQIGDSQAARQTSPISVQIPKTGQQVMLDRSYLQVDRAEPIRLDYMSDSSFRMIDGGVWALGIGLVLALLYAARRLKAWFEVLLVTVFLLVEVLLDLLSAELARDFLSAGLLVIAVLGAHRLGRAGLRRARAAGLRGGDAE